MIDQANGASRESSVSDEYFDATDEMPTGTAEQNGSTPSHTIMSPSISVVTLEGDPPEIEEDKDYHEINNVDG